MQSIASLCYLSVIISVKSPLIQRLLTVSFRINPEKTDDHNIAVYSKTCYSILIYDQEVTAMIPIFSESERLIIRMLNEQDYASFVEGYNLVLPAQNPFDEGKLDTSFMTLS